MVARHGNSEKYLTSKFFVYVCGLYVPVIGGDFEVPVIIAFQFHDANITLVWLIILI